MILTLLTLLFIFIYMLESLAIIAQSGFTVVVLGREWVQFKRLSPVEMILISLGICRFFLQWSSVLYNFFFYFNPNYILQTIAIIWEFANILTYWVTSLLAVFYCIKVSCITHPVFLWLKWRFLRLVPWLLLGSLVITCMAIIPSAVRFHIHIELSTMEHAPRNSTLKEKLEMFEQRFLKAHKVLMLTIPFLLFLISTVLLMASLLQHWEQMHQHNTSQCSTSQKAHATVLRSLTIFFVFFTAYFVTIIMSLMDFKPKIRTWFWAWESAIYAIVSIHSTSLMLSSPTLKKLLKTKYWGLEAAQGTGHKETPG
ncbi:taste receptor type 2 member 16 [Ctenodactylus gundi]